MSAYINLLINLLAGASIAVASISSTVPISQSSAFLAETAVPEVLALSLPKVPFYSQFSDINSGKWQKLGCGITSLAMLINFYKPGAASVNYLLNEGISAGAFINGAGWSHGGLALLASKYGLKGSTYDLSNLDAESAFAQFKGYLKEGPVMASVHYKLEPGNPIPHLIVINGIDNDAVYYNDPAGKFAGQKISIQDFIKAWKKRFIVIRP